LPKASTCAGKASGAQSRVQHSKCGSGIPKLASILLMLSWKIQWFGLPRENPAMWIFCTEILWRYPLRLPLALGTPGGACHVSAKWASIPLSRRYKNSWLGIKGLIQPKKTKNYGEKKHSNELCFFTIMLKAKWSMGYWAPSTFLLQDSQLFDKAFIGPCTPATVAKCLTVHLPSRNVPTAIHCPLI